MLSLCRYLHIHKYLKKKKKFLLGTYKYIMLKFNVRISYQLPDELLSQKMCCISKVNNFTILSNII